MAFEVKFALVTKKQNSTQQPADGDYLNLMQYECVLKDGCDILMPVIKIVASDAKFAPIAANYCYIPTFNRYYYVTWRYESRAWWAYLSVDVLASWKTTIGQSTQYVLRAQNARNENVTDTQYPITSDISYSRDLWNWNFATRPEDGWYIVGIISANATAQGNSTYYVFNVTQFNLFRNKLFSDVSYLGITEISNELQKALVNPLQYVSSCKWSPIKPPVSGLNYTYIKIGFWELTGFNCEVLSDQAVTTVMHTFTVPQHPQSSTRGNWLNLSPYTEHNLFLPTVGVISIEPSALTSQKLLLQLDIDFVTGKCNTLLYTYYTITGIETTFKIYSATQSILCDIAISQLTQTLSKDGAILTAGGAAFASLGMAAGQMTSNAYTQSGSAAINAFGAVSQFKSSFVDPANAGVHAPNIANAALTAGRTLGTFGTSESVYQFRQNPVLVSRFARVADENLSKYGAPVMENWVISQLGGYILCGSPTLAGPFTAEEHALILAYMSGGFYYE